MAKSDKNQIQMLGNHHFKHPLWPNLTKIVTLNANLKKIIPPVRSGQGQMKVRSGQVARMNDSDLTINQVDLIQKDDFPADSCALSHTAFLFL